MRVNGQAVRAARDAKGISRERLAARVGVSSSTIREIESDRPGSPAADTLYLISLELDVPIQTLFTDEPLAQESVA